MFPKLHQLSRLLVNHDTVDSWLLGLSGNMLWWGVMQVSSDDSQGVEQDEPPSDQPTVGKETVPVECAGGFSEDEPKPKNLTRKQLKKLKKKVI